MSLSLKLQEAAVKALGPDRGAVVMLDPRTGRVLAMASTPTFDANAIANPVTASAAFRRTAAAAGQPFLNRATMGLYVPGSVFKIVTSIAALGSGAITPSTTYPQQPAAEIDRPARVRLPDPRRAPRLHRLARPSTTTRRSKSRATSTSP